MGRKKKDKEIEVEKIMNASKNGSYYEAYVLADNGVLIYKDDDEIAAFKNMEEAKKEYTIF